MARSNIAKRAAPVFTHGGGKAVANLTAMQKLRRSVLSCMLFEDEFYEDGVKIADRIADLAKQVKPEELAELAVEVRSEGNLRHVPLLLLTALIKTGSGRQDGLVSEAIARVIQRPDELGELLAVYKKVNGGKRVPLAGQLKKGLAKAFVKFDEYALGKYNKNKGEVEYTLKDVLFMSHAEPIDQAQKRLWKRLVNDKLKTPDTWEVQLSGGADKKETFTRLIEEGKLGYFALVRNLRNMQQAGVDNKLVREAILARKNGAHRLLPFRFVAAAQAAPIFEDVLDQAMVANLQDLPKLPGTTVVIIDVSGSMYGGAVSRNSDMDRARAACALGAIAREVCENPVIFATAGNDYSHVHKTELVPARRGMALVQAIYDMCRPLGGGGIFLTQCLKYVRDRLGGQTIDRVIVITDEQDCSRGGEDAPSKAPILGESGNYIINVGSYENGIGYRNGWTNISGFSEAVMKYIYAVENLSRQ